MPRNLLAIEFFSGIGGLAYGLLDACPEAEVVASFDTNVVANKVYLHNWAKTTSTRGIDRLDAGFLQKLNADCWLMSPPCQPYTSGGKRLDLDDIRTEPLKNLISILENLESPPMYLFLENVPNFELSQSRNRLIMALNTHGYTINEFLISPMQFGIPNNRRRYYLTAVRCSNAQNYPINEPRIHIHPFNYCPKLPNPPIMIHLSKFLDELTPQETLKWLVKDADIFKRKNFRFDVVNAAKISVEHICSRESGISKSPAENCANQGPNFNFMDSAFFNANSSRLDYSNPISSTFTKAYGSHHFFGSGSFLQTKKLNVITKLMVRSSMTVVKGTKH